MALLVITDRWLPAAIILWIAIATDVMDGYIARVRNQTSALGGLLDHSADAFFVTCLLTALASGGYVTLLLPILVVAAFLQYMLDSDALAGHPLRASHLGRYNGIFYFVLGGYPVMQHTFGLFLLEDNYIYWISCGLLISTLISMADRLAGLLQNLKRKNKGTSD